MCCLWLSISPSCSFGPRMGFLWLVLNEASIPFPCKMTYPLNSAYVLLPRCLLAIFMMCNTRFWSSEGGFLTFVRQRKKAPETKSFLSVYPCMKGLYGGLFFCVWKHEHKFKSTSRQIMFYLSLLTHAAWWEEAVFLYAKHKWWYKYDAYKSHPVLWANCNKILVT